MSSWKQAVWVTKQIKDAVHFTEKYEQLEQELAEYNSDLDLIDESLDELRQIIADNQAESTASIDQLVQEVKAFTKSEFWTSVVPMDSFGSRSSGEDAFVVTDKEGQVHEFYLQDELAKNGGTVFLADNANDAAGLAKKLADKYGFELPDQGA